MNQPEKLRLISSPGKPLRGSVSLPGDKSLAHRAALLAGLAHGESRIDNYLVAGVTAAMLGALAALGVPWKLEGRRLLVNGRGLSELAPAGKPLDCGNSATTLRLLAGALAAAGLPVVLDGSPGLRLRPMMRIVTPLQMMGVAIQPTQGCAPLILAGSARPLKPLHYRLPVASAQVKSCLLLAALAADGNTTLIEPGPSRDHTELMLRNLGISVVSRQVIDGDEMLYETQLEPPQPLRLPPLELTLPGDISSAAFLIVAALITPGAQIEINRVCLNPTRTGLIDALRQMGAEIDVRQAGDQHGELVGDLLVRYSPLHGTRVAGPLVVRMIDEFPAFAIAAAYAQGETIVSQAEELRLKESDRIGVLCSQLRLLGADIHETSDGFVLYGDGRLDGGTVAAHGDHRLAMALAVAGLASREPVVVLGAEAYRESFPDFDSVLHGLGADVALEPVTR
ncbi:MAG: 3-phosphoshikimate 1-carboxyvinyltransferase [Chloroflexi bacterium RBG_16_58_14]|nr:MAG: 3-phosphoshikimate 1-carboxyvinyltransferase [Chloroflexi bacterium RBG_16_58_14]